MEIAIGSDHAGFLYKEAVGGILKEMGHVVLDLGTSTEESTDYPTYALRVANKVASKEVPVGVLVCGSGIGVAMTANKIPGVRAANCLTPEMASLAREHNDANILTIGQRLVDRNLLPEILAVFLGTDTSSHQRHRRRVEMIHELTGC